MSLLERKILPGAMIFLLCLTVYIYLKQPAASIDSITHFTYSTADEYSTPEQIMERYQAGKFLPVGQTIFNKGIADRCYWFHFNVAGTGSEKLLLEIENARINKMELFAVTNNQITSLGKSGDFYPFAQRDIKNKNFLYRLPENPTSDYFLFVNQIGSTFVLPVRLIAEDDFYANNDSSLFASGWVFGILVFVALMSLLYFIASRYSLYFYYSAYIITAVIWFFSYFGMGYAYIWGQYPGLNTAMAPAAASVNILLNLQICQSLLKLSTSHPTLHRFFQWCKLLLGVIAVFPFVFILNNYGYAVNNAYLIVFLSTILVSMFLLCRAVFGSLKRSTVARLYFTASILKALSIINLALIEFGILSPVAGMEAILQTGILVEILLLTYALARRYTNYKLNTFSKVIEAHEKERATISREIHDSISNSLTGIHYALDDLLQDEKQLSEPGKQLLKRLSAEMRKLHTEARNISHNVMPEYIEKRTISETIERYLTDIQTKRSDAENPVAIQFRATNQSVPFAKEVKLNLFRIVQEMVTNILKHANASEALIEFDFRKNKLVITATDNGRGITNAADMKGMGIKNIKSRVELLRGEVSFASNSEKTERVEKIPVGTRIEIKIPYQHSTTKQHIYEY